MADSGLIRSPLATRLKRHSRMATLVRPASLLSGAPYSATEWGGLSGVVQARPLRLEDAPLAEETAGTTAAIFDQQPSPAPNQLPAQPLTQALKPVKPSALAPARSGASSVAPAAVQRIPLEPPAGKPNVPAQSLAPESTPVVEEERDNRPWRRLQAILNRHLDRPAEKPARHPDVEARQPSAQGVSESAATAQAPSAPVVQRAVSLPGNEQAEEELPAQAGSSGATAPAAQSAGSAGKGAFPPAGESTPPGPEQAEGSAPLQAVVPSGSQTPRPPEQAAPVGQPEAAQTEQAAPVGQPAAEHQNEGFTSASEASGQEMRPVNAEPARPQPGSPAAPQPEVSSQPAQPAQSQRDEAAFQPQQPGGESLNPLPLEEVWPVQRRVEPSPRRPIDPPAARGASQGAPASSLPGAEPFVEALGGVKPGQPTESAIEFVPPRKARPVEPARRESTAPSPQSAPPPQAQEAGAVPGEAGLDEPQETALVQRMPVASRPTASDAPQPRPEAPAEVDTEIGALPADLWAIIGEKPPQPKPAARRNEGQGLKEPASTPRRPEVVQRAVEIDEVTAQPAEQPAPGQPPPPPGTPPQGGVSIDELARQVYAEIRRRLAVEREWFRGDR